jgi:uncharacterized LabA/DUF88 family protein
MLEKTLVFIDDGFLSKVSKRFGEGEYLKVHRKRFAEYLCCKEGLDCVGVFVYTAPPFQGSVSDSIENTRKRGYDKFVHKLRREGIIVREGRCQKLKIDGKLVYRQKGVDVLLTIDLMKVFLKREDVSRVILVASDSDFVPVIEEIRGSVKSILYTYFDGRRGTNFSRCNYLIRSVWRYVKLERGDFDG